MKKITLFIALAFLSFTGYSQNAAKEHARELLEITGSAKLGLQVINTMFASYKKQIPSVPASFWDEFSKELNPTELVELIVPIYVKYYTDQELIGLIEFYKTPLGKKVINTLPLITQDSYGVGEEWGLKIAERVSKKLREKGYENQ